MKNLLFLLSVLLVSVSFGQTAEEYKNQGNAKYDLQDYRGAILDYNKAIELDPTNVKAYNNRGMAKANANLQDYRGAILDFTKAIELDPTTDAIPYYNRGLAKYALSNIDGACLDWSKAGELGYGDAYEYIKKYCN